MRMRSFLTVLGVVIGVGAVIAMVTIGNGTTAKVAADLAKLGSNLLFVRPGQFGPGRASADAKPFTIRDVEALKSQLLGVRAVAPVAQKMVTLIYGSENRSVLVTGTDNGYFIAQDWPLAAGRAFLDSEVRGGRAACIIGETVRDKLFGRGDAIGHSIRVGKVSCEVIGMLGIRGQSSSGTDQDDVVFVPLRVFQRRIAGNTQRVEHLDFGGGRRRDVEGSGGHRAAAARAARHHLRQGGRFLGPRHEADRRDADRHDHAC